MVAAAPIEAQQTRAEEHAKKQAEKAGALRPPEPNRAERIVTKVTNSSLFGATPVGIYPVVRSIYPGGWIAVGAGYRRPYADSGSIIASGAWSIRNFKTVDLQVRSPLLVGGRFNFDVHANWIDAPTVAFYGLGAQSRNRNKARFGYEPITVGAAGQVRPHRFVTIGGGADYLDINTSTGAPQTSIQERFSTLTVPGLGSDPEYIRSRGFVQFDWRQNPGYTGTGGLYRIVVDRYAERSHYGVGFRSVEGEVVQLVPFLRANWVIALRGLVTVTDTPTTGHVVPFYLMPSIGGTRTLRGYSSFRFRGAHRMAGSVEYRWTPSKFMDMAIFYDVGKVADRRSDLDFNDLKSSVGVGARIHGAAGTVLRLEVAHSRENTARLIFAATAPF